MLLEVGVGGQTSCPNTDQVEPYVSVYGLSRYSNDEQRQGVSIRLSFQRALLLPPCTNVNVVLNIDITNTLATGEQREWEDAAGNWGHVV